LTWLATKLFFKKTWIFLKENWQIPFLVVWTLVTYAFASRNTDALLQVIEAKQESHKKQIDALRRSHRDEVLKIKGLQDQYLQTIEELEKKFENQNKSLSLKHAEDVKEIVIKSKGNPEEIKRKIENEFNIRFKN